MSITRSVFGKFNRRINNLFNPHEKYIQLRLSVKKITKEFEEMLKDKIEHNIISAEIRKGVEEDVDSIIKLYDQAWHSTTMPFHNLSKKKLLKLLKDSDTLILIAKVNSIDKGFAIIYLIGDNNKIGVIGALGVVPELQRKGLGTRLGMAIWDYFKEKEVIELKCTVYEDNKGSYSFITALGFEEEDISIVPFKF